MKHARALIIPAVGPKLSATLFENSSVLLVQVTGAGLDRLDLGRLKQLGVSVANVPGGSNSADSRGPMQKFARETIARFARACSQTIFLD
jgi:lactate dehydrogenase-like 2-hydroxyacid dehydrogenase